MATWPPRKRMGPRVLSIDLGSLTVPLSYLSRCRYGNHSIFTFLPPISAVILSPFPRGLGGDVIPASQQIYRNLGHHIASKRDFNMVTRLEANDPLNRLSITEQY